MDTQRQNFWKESINKEATVRLLWHMKFSKEFAKSSFQPKPRKEGFLPKPLLTLDPLKIPQSTKSRTSSKKGQTDTGNAEPPPKENMDALMLVEMRPVTPKTRSLLYKGFSALGEGRYAYLQARKQKKPEQKYEFPITSGWEYGWKITDAMKNSSTRPAEFGRTRIVKDSFYRTNGVLPQENLSTVETM